MMNRRLTRLRERAIHLYSIIIFLLSALGKCAAAFTGRRVLVFSDLATGLPAYVWDGTAFTNGAIVATAAAANVTLPGTAPINVIAGAREGAGTETR